MAQKRSNSLAVGISQPVIDISGDRPVLLREGKGDIRPFGFVKAALH